ncbi:MAG: CO dehydrogenase/acetyl-CoA synthase complex subunit epsilon [Methanospirillum sp.]|uniref:CO dehydrogenase/acetyl-CoA synthase complex subunit epsilon n=1 Tax=Methanospirillum sp. TaxID=45200 RepID=UPI00236FE3BA|nr:CO dehydrogenase/acetyl-CoA synthase complex subunit epsilon [Methanospirillum sp.]MDD1728356.1 CO dehydrogenase/acetyl-CoA synthase complex subunit epsilon [Methanospirillum sp.]
MAGDDAWMRAEMGGTSRASVIGKPEVVGALLKRAKRPLFIVGHEVTATGLASGPLTRFMKAGSTIRHIPVIATSSTARDLIAEGIQVAAIMGSMEIIDRLRDPEWKGFDGQGSYDLIFLAGLPYQFCWTLLSGLRNGAPALKTVTLDPKYHPHASWSFGNMATGPWQEQLQAITALLEEKHV